jgi:uncharacterized protein YhfF
MTVDEMWRAYLGSVGEIAETTPKTYESWYFCDNEADAEELAELCKNGIKRATASLLSSCEAGKEPLPKTGDLHIITGWAGNAVCVIRVTGVEILPFKLVTEEHARIEGEGDKSLAYWREGHIRFFTREAQQNGQAFTEASNIVFMIFEVVFR